MGKRGSRRLLPFALVIVCACLWRQASAQLVIGQYEDEAPLRTWNLLGAPSAAALGLGDGLFAMPTDVTAVTGNPALLAALPHLSAALTGSFAAASLFRYSLVNTGVLASRGNLTAGALALDSAGVALSWRGWTLAAAAALLEDYGRPSADVADSSVGFALTMDQTGFLRGVHFGVARRVTGTFAAGLTVTVVSGRLERTIEERHAAPSPVYTITDAKAERYRGVYLNGGVSWRVSDRFALGLVFRSPYTKKAEASSDLRYQAPAEGTDIRIQAQADNAYREPWIAGAGLVFDATRNLRAVADVAVFGWSHYGVVYFEEPLDRTFRDIVRLSAGLVYEMKGRVFGRDATIPLRVGAAYDPQPMAEPRSSYLSLSFGTGVRTGPIAADIGASLGGERGSGNSLKAAKVALTLTWMRGPQAGT